MLVGAALLCWSLVVLVADQWFVRCLLVHVHSCWCWLLIVSVGASGELCVLHCLPLNAIMLVPVSAPVCMLLLSACVCLIFDYTGTC